MARLTLKKVNAALPEGYELVKGDGYFWFDGPTTHKWMESGVYGVFRLNDMSLERWVLEFNVKFEEYQRSIA